MGFIGSGLLDMVYWELVCNVDIWIENDHIYFVGFAG